MIKTVASADRIKEIINFALTNNDKAACSTFDITEETLARYKRDYKNKLDIDLTTDTYLKEIQTRYTPAELKAIAKGKGFSPPNLTIPNLDFEGEHFRFGFISDTHIGSYYLKEKVLSYTIKEIKKHDAEILIHTGDVTDGLSKSIPGHIYELEHIGYAPQKKRAIELLGEWEKPLLMIDGNHDRWFQHTNNALIVEDICEALPNAIYLGQDVGRYYIKDNISVMLWHGRDGSSYAISYRLQKIVEAFSGGTKPKLLLCGHTHKQGYFFERNVHVLSGGCIQLQTPFLRGKRIAVHPGFWIIDIWFGHRTIKRISPTWYPFYA